MFDIGWSEMMVIGVVALIVVGPKDLPKMFHTVGQVMGKARGMAREFQRAMDAAARETGVSDVAKDLRKTASGQAFKEAVGFDDIEKEFRDIGHDRPAVRKPTTSVRPKVAEPVEESDDTDLAAAHDAEVAARNAELTATEALRLKRAEQSAAARVKAAEARARREAAESAAPAAAEPQAWRPAPPPPAASPETES